MKKVFCIIAILCVGISFAHATPDNESGLIPAWVKNVTTPEEYKIWEEVVKYYDYDFENSALLLSRRAATDKVAREKAYNRIKEAVAEKQRSDVKNKKKPKLMEGFDLERVVVPQIKNSDISALVYSSIQGYDVHLKVSARIVGVAFDENSVLSNSRIETYSLSGIQSSFEPLLFTFQLQKDKSRYLVNVSGFLKYSTPKGEDKSEFVNVIVGLLDCYPNRDKILVTWEDSVLE